MPLTKVLQSIQTQISEIIPSLETFSDSRIQPGVHDCELLQKQLAELQENLAVYKFSQRDIDFSPSFKIHAMISEKEIPAEAPVQETRKESAHTVTSNVDHEAPVNKPATPTPPATQKHKGFVVNINDKFRFINELFSQNNSEYNIAFQQLSNLNSWNESEIYLNSLKNLYGWKENSEVVKYFYSTVRKRFE
jgi:hypothetical protein